jgi:hypothetical protein
MSERTWAILRSLAQRVPDDLDAIGWAIANAAGDAIESEFVAHELHAYRYPDAHGDCDFCADTTTYTFSDLVPN